MKIMKLSIIHISLFVSCLLVRKVNSLDLQDVTKTINSMDTTWRARMTPKSEALLRLINKAKANDGSYTPIGGNTSRSSEFSMKPDVPILYHKYQVLRVPSTFDARDQWAECGDLIGKIWDQDNCLSGWAVTTASIITDRVCIESNATGTFLASVEDILFCCPKCATGNRCLAQEGSVYEALRFWVNEGVVSGGELNSSEVCKPYSSSASGEEKSCVKECADKKISYAKDKNHGRWVYQVASFESSQICQEMLTHGPVIATMELYLDLLVYQNGLYQHHEGSVVGYLWVKIVGWGRDNKKDHWLVANTWGTEWGMAGFFKIPRGENHCRIEDALYAGRYLKGITPREWFAPHTKMNSQENAHFQFLLMIFAFVNLLNAL